MLYVEFLNQDPEVPWPEDVQWRSPEYFMARDVDNNICSDFAKEACKGIDKTEIINENLAISPIFGSIPTDWLSGGFLTLMCMIHNPEVRCHVARCGPNVYPWIVKAAETRDIHVVAGTPADFPHEFTCVIENSGLEIHSAGEMWHEFMRLEREGKI